MSCGCHQTKLEINCYGGNPNSGAFNVFVTNKIKIIEAGVVTVLPGDFKEQMVSVYNIEVSDMGGAYSVIIVLPKLPAQYQCVAFFELLFPESPEIEITFVQFLSGNPELIKFVTDGSGIPAVAQLAYNGTDWTVTNGNWIE